MTTIRVGDIETECHEYLGRKASPYCPDNYIVMNGWQDFNWDGTPKDRSPSCVHWESKEAHQKGHISFDGIDIYIAHNAMFEMSWFLTHHREEFLAFIKRGGRVLCTQMAEYLLSHQVHIYPALGEIASKYGGTDKIDAVKAMWDAGCLTSEIDPDLLRTYLIGGEWNGQPVDGDIGSAAKVFFGQRTALANQGMWQMYLERCDALLSYSLCETAGLYVDKETAERNLKEQTEEAEAIKVECEALLPELPEYFEFNWGSRYHMSAWIFGGEVKYKTKVSYEPKKFEKIECYKYGDVYVPVADEQPTDLGEPIKFKSGKNKGLPKTFKVDSNVEKLKWGDATFKFPGLIKGNLPPVIADNLGPKGDWAGKQELPCGTPVYSTSGDVLKVLGNHGFEQAKLLRRLGDLNKDIGTYYRKVDYNADGTVKKESGMLQYVGPDGIVHHSLNATATITGRLSSSNPNLQNLPRDGTSKVKQMFASRFGEHGRIIEVDYSALEVVMLAALTKDQNLLDKLLAGTDMHCLRLSAKLGEDYESVYKKCHDEDHPEHKEYKEMRTGIKAPSFAAQYGATAEGIAYATGVSVEFAQEFLDTEAALFPQAIGFRNVVLNSARETGAKNLQREQRPDGTWMVYGRGYWQSPGGTKYSFRQYEQWIKGVDGKRRKQLDYKKTQIANYWCQGEAGFMMAISMGRIARWLIANDFFGGKCYLINNVHDAAYVDAHEDVYERVALGVKAIMEDAPRYMSEVMGYDIAHVPFPAEAEAGLTMYKKSTIHA